jgi:hypothetical protein|nr:MAG TPA: hypothetical protein [Caudoviricetes sp.]
MKLKTEIVIEMLDALLVGKYDPYQFSIDFAEFCFDNYEALENEYNGLGYYLDQVVPEICDEGEPGFDPAHMIAELKKVYDKTKAIINQD